MWTRRVLFIFFFFCMDHKNKTEFDMVAEVTKRSARHSPPPPNPYPWLVFVHGKKFRNQTFYDVVSSNQSKYTHHLKSIPEFKNEPIIVSSQEWLVVYSSNKESPVKFHLWNPVTFDSIYLPPLELQSAHSISCILLTKPPTDPDSALLVFIDNRRTHSIVFSYIKDPTWTTRVYDEQVKVIGKAEDNWDRFCNPVVLNDRIYASTFRVGHMAEIEIVKPKRLFIRPLGCRRPFSPGLGPGSGIRHRWVGCGDELFLICISSGGVRNEEVDSILVYKLEFSTMNWNLVQSCPNIAFFIGACGEAISCPISNADSGRVGNRVYFTLDEDKALYIYNIQDRTISVSLLSPEIPTPWKTPFWILISDVDVPTQTQAKDDYPVSNGVVNGQKRDGNEKVEDHSEFMVPSKGEKVTREVANTVTLLDDLPIEILEKISSRLLPLDYLNFRAASRSCRSVGSAKQWRNNSVLFASTEFENGILSPWLMVPSQANAVSSMLDHIPSGPNTSKHNKYYIRTPKIFEKDYRIWYSTNGWLLMANEFLSEEIGYAMLHLRLYNPLTKSIICLPEVPSMDHFLFFDQPSSPDCAVVGISLYLSRFYVIQPGMSEWDEQELTLEDGPIYSEQTNIYSVFMDGCFYFLCRKGNLGVLSLGEHGNTLRCHQLKRPCCSFQHNFLVECSGDLLSVYIGRAWKWVRVFKLDQSRMVWKEVKDLMSKTLYLSRVSSVATEAKGNGMGNRIYFWRFYGESIMYYSLDTCKLHYSDEKESGNSLMDYYGSKEQLNCCWFEPRL